VKVASIKSIALRYLLEDSSRKTALSKTIRIDCAEYALRNMNPREIEFLKNRRSIRKYEPKEISEEILEIILEGATWAPSAHNTQPWRFIVIKNSVLKLRLARAMAAFWKRDLIKDGVTENDCKNLVETSVERFSNAPLLVIPCLTMVGMHQYHDKQRQKIEFLMGVQSVAAAIENMLLAAHAMGLGACWFCAPMFCPDVVRKVLKLPSNFEPQALITLGYPAFRPEAPSRKPLKEITQLDGWSRT
jgi:coenzyme F420-0:L-glutamate ligase/coenzyme F420-1:gamma-L-glutamate ligase